MTYQRPINQHGIPIQQSLTVNPDDYIAYRVDRTMLGVILTVHQSDSIQNSSAYKRADYRGYFHTADVLVIQDGRDTFVPLRNVVITPDMVSGLDSYYERIPRGCSSTVNGQIYNPQLSQINIQDLDGDWCVVGFLGGNLDIPYVVRWWPHPKNTYDPATSGRRNPVTPSDGATLKQLQRHFVRINGIEYLISDIGNIYLSTYRANSTLNFGNEISPEEGRFPRTLDNSTGGSIKIWIKPSQSFELDFNRQEEGIGIEDLQDDALPQSNPGGRHTSNGNKDNTFLKLNNSRAYLTTLEEIKLVSKQRFLLESEEDTTITIGGDGSISAGGSLSISADRDLDIDITGQTSITANTTLDVQTVGQATINSQATLTLSSVGVLSLAGSQVSIGSGGSSGGPGSISVTDTGVNLGTGSLGGAVGGDGLRAAVIAFAAAVAAAQSLATVETAYATALTNAANALVTAIEAAISSTTRVG